MELTSTDLPEGIRKITLSGRLDVQGANDIDLKFTVLTSGERVLAVIDLSGVDFMASLGISTLVRNARSAKLRGGNLVLLRPQPNVAKVLASTGIDKVISICYEWDDALVAVRGPASPLL
jgi:anti-sigma B factor antagonist